MEDYVVQYNDTLGTIAEKKLGNKNRWVEIAKLNEIQSPYQLFVGQVIKLPRQQPPVFRNTPSPSTNYFPPASFALARGFLFVVYEQLPEVGSDKVIRKIAKVPTDFSKHPHLTPTGPFANVTTVKHALDGAKPSQYLSASNRPLGSPTNVNEYIREELGSRKPSSVNPKEFIGRDRPVLIDLQRLPFGTNIVTEGQLINDLNSYAGLVPEEKARVSTLIRTIKNVEGEVLIPGAVARDAVKKVSNVHSAYILTAEELNAKRVLGQITEEQLTAELGLLTKSYNRMKIVGHVGRVITVVGIVFTVVDVAKAAQRSSEKGSYKPLAAETVRQIGGWGGAWAGGELGFTVGAALGIETGPGLFVTGAIGTIVFGAAGYMGASWVADWIDDNSVAELRKDVNRVENLRNRDITLTVEANESQYDFRRRALMAAAVEAQRQALKMGDSNLPLRYADKLAPPNGSNVTKNYEMIWTGNNPVDDKNKDGKINPAEWKIERGKSFTYQLNDGEVDELIKMLFGLSR